MSGTQSNPPNHPQRSLSGNSHKSNIRNILYDPGRERNKHLCRDPLARLRPLLVLPLKPEDSNYEEDWIAQENSPGAWISLFYDLVFVGTLTVWSDVGELSSASSVWVYISFFIIMWHLWQSQLLYDLRYQANDLVHRVMKLCQLVVFVFLAASSGGAAFVSQRSFKNVVIIYAASRALLGAQYCFQLLLAHKRKRQTRPIWLAISGNVISGVLAAIAAGIHPSTNALADLRIALFYVGILIQSVQSYLGQFQATKKLIHTEELSERMANLTLIIIGEGFISVLRTFNSAVSNFSSSVAGIYVEVFCSIVTLYSIYLFLFTDFDVTHYMGKRRAALWTFAHFPLYLMILLTIGAMVNEIKATAFSNATARLGQTTSSILESLGTNTYPPPGIDITSYSLQLSTLQIYPPWEDELQALNESFHSQTDLRDPYIISYQYYNSIVFSAAAAYGVDTTNVYESYVEAQSQNTTQASTKEDASEAEQQCLENTIDIINDLLSELFNGTIWLYGTAGGILIMSAILSLIRHDHVGNDFRSIEFVQMGAGVILCLVNLTALGDNFFSFKHTGPVGGFSYYQNQPSPMFTLDQTGFSLPIVSIFFTTVYPIELYMLRRKRRSIQRRSSEDEKVAESPA